MESNELNDMRNQVEAIFRRVISMETGTPVEEGLLAIQFIMNGGEEEFTITLDDLERIIQLARDAIVEDLPPIEKKQTSVIL